MIAPGRLSAVVVLSAAVPDDGWEITLYNDGGVGQTFTVYAI